MTPTPSRPALTVNQPPETVMVRSVTGRLLTRISFDAASELLAAGHAEAIGRDRVRYIRLHRDIRIERGPRGWWLVEEARRVYGDDATRRGIQATEHPRLRFVPPGGRL